MKSSRGSCLPLRDQCVDVRLDVADGLALVVLVEKRVREHPLDPVEPALLVLLRQVHEPRERAEGHRMGELRDDLAAALRGDRLEQPRREGLELRAQRLDPRLREDDVHETPVPRVLRRVELDRQQRFGARLRRRDDRRADHGRGERLVVERGAGHVVVARQQPEAAVQVGMDERMLLADRADRALRVLDELRVVVVEAQLPASVTRPRTSPSTTSPPPARRTTSSPSARKRSPPPELEERSLRPWLGCPRSFRWREGRPSARGRRST